MCTYVLPLGFSLGVGASDIICFGIYSKNREKKKIK